MGKELVISANRHETKVAVLEDDQLVEIYFQRTNEYSLAGSIHKGRVTRVLPGMQSAFVDIGLERDAFLYVSDFFEDNEEYDRIAGPAEDTAVRQRVVEVKAPAAEPAPPPPAETLAPAPAEEPEGRDRRGRRSRRRRTRGHGFPESKYAEVGRREAEEPQEGGQFSVLPGESLAKYPRRTSERTGEVPEPGSYEMAKSEAAAPEEERPEPPADCAAPTDDELAATDPNLAMAPPTAEETPEPEGRPAETAPPEPLLTEPVADEEAPETEVSEPPDDAAAEADAGEFDLATGIPEPAIPAEAGEPAGEAEAAPEGEEIEPARMPVSLTATLREQGHRYMHRVSRRMRRKMRTAGPPEAEKAKPQDAPAPEPNGRARQEKSGYPSITELLKEGQEVLVQIAKEPLGQKGARITSHIALPGRYVVYMPTVEHLGVSRKIASEEERLRLKRILQTHRAGVPGGFIVRTAGEGKSEHDIAADMRFLFNLWLDIRQKAESKPAPVLIHHDLDLVSRILRDQVTESFKAVWVDNEEIYAEVLGFVQRFQPAAVARVKLYTRDTPIFDSFNITPELEKALRPKVWLKSGGYIVLNQTEALVAIDVNTGKFVGRSNRLEDTIVKTNTEAVKEIVRQVRLRDLGGIIVVDFIDMDERKSRQKVFQALEEAMRADRAPNKILQFNDFGLVAITRKRVKQSLERTLCSPCPYCEGAGYVKSVQTVISEILQEAHKIAKVVEGKEVMLRVNPEIAKLLKSSENDYLEELEEVLGRPVAVTSDPTLHQEKFDLV